MSLLQRMTAALPQILGDIETLVICESPSSDLAAVSASAEVVAGIGAARLGAEPNVLVRDGCTHLRWRLGTGPRKILVLGHHDTVWPKGTLATHPFSVADGVLRGPGCFDMKAGVVMAFHALATLSDVDGVTVLITGDEEMGSATSRELIETEARGCIAALVLEAAADGGALKTVRKGVSTYEVVAHGRAAHAGLEPHKGVNAAVELAHQIHAVIALADPDRGTTVTPTVLRAGTTTNTVPATGSFAVDVRVATTDEQDRIDTAIRALKPVLPGAALTVEAGPSRPPLEAAASAHLFARAQRLARAHGLPKPTSASVGGGSDGNLTAGVGVATLDGLGASGGGAHADDEHVMVDELPARTALVATLIADLLGDAEPSAPTNEAASSGAPRP